MSFFGIGKKRERNYIDPAEHRQIARELEKHHAIFERVWSMSRIRYTKKVPTAAVFFNMRGELVDFAVNKKFWESLTFIQKCFVLSHECLHIALNHGRRSSELYNDPVKMLISNVAQDLVINHALVNRYGFNRDDIDALEPLTREDGRPVVDQKTGEQIVARKYCWVDQIFKPEDNVRDDENFEYYYNRLMREFEKNKEEMQNKLKNMQTVDDHDVGNQTQGQGQPGQGQPGQGQPGEEDQDDGSGENEGEEEKDGEGEGQGQGQDGDEKEGEGKGNGQGGDEDSDLDLDETDFDYFDPSDPDLTDDFEPVIDKLDKELKGEEKDSLKNFLEENEGSGETMENADYGPTGVGTANGGTNGGSQAGTTAGTAWTFANKTEPKKRKWEAIITDWTKKRLKETSRDVDQFVFPNRRFASVIAGSDLMLPSEYEVWEKFKEEDMIDVWFFQDTSGSCSGYTDRFFSIAESMPMDRFRMRLFCFDTRVYETSLESRKLYGFGGTYFHILENRIQEELRDNPDFEYPDAIFVVTDGFGSNIVPEKPDKWHWIITPGGSKECIPNTCKFYDLAKYE